MKVLFREMERMKEFEVFDPKGYRGRIIRKSWLWKVLIVLHEIPLQQIGARVGGHFHSRACKKKGGHTGEVVGIEFNVLSSGKVLLEIFFVGLDIMPKDWRKFVIEKLLNLKWEARRRIGATKVKLREEQEKYEFLSSIIPDLKK